MAPQHFYIFFSCKFNRKFKDDQRRLKFSLYRKGGVGNPNLASKFFSRPPLPPTCPPHHLPFFLSLNHTRHPKLPPVPRFSLLMCHSLPNNISYPFSHVSRRT